MGKYYYYHLHFQIKQTNEQAKLYSTERSSDLATVTHKVYYRA